MKDPIILDDNFYPQLKPTATEQLKLRYEAYFDTIKTAFRWRLIALSVWALFGLIFLINAHSDWDINGQYVYYLFFAMNFTVLIAYFYHFFALQKGAICAYLSNHSKIPYYKIYNPWLLWILAAGLNLVISSIIFPKESIIADISPLFVHSAATHACFLGIQQLLLRKYISYLPAIFNKKPFASVGFAPFICWLITGVLFATLLFLALSSAAANNPLAIFNSLAIISLFVAFILGFLYIALHIQSEKHLKQEQKIGIE